MKVISGNRHSDIHRVIVESDSDLCCVIDIHGDPDPQWPFMAIGRLTHVGMDGFTFRQRLKMAWRALRGNLWGHEFEFWSRTDAERFLEEVRKVKDLVFG